MEGKITPTEGIPRKQAAHLMCRTPFWGVAAALASAYFAYSSYARLRSGDLYWQHDWWTILTWVVWVVLIAGLVNETRCWRERLFFGTLLLNFFLGLVLSAWERVPTKVAQNARGASVALWVLAMVAAIGTTFSPPKAHGGKE